MTDTTVYHLYPRYRVNAYQKRDSNQVFSEMNTTPLIDVLLVLLVMLILTIPIATHQVDVDLPSPGPKVADAPQVAITFSPGGTVFWDGEPVTASQLDARLARAAALDPAPVIRFQPDPQASYDAAVQVIVKVKDAGITRFAFAGNEQFRSFAKD